MNVKISTTFNCQKTRQLENQSDVGFCDFPRTDSIETNFRTRGFLQNALS